MKIYLNAFSNAPLRVRIAIALKKLVLEEVHVDLENEDYECQFPTFSEINPQRMLPVLVDGDNVFHQSLAILEYFEEKVPFPPLLPHDAEGKARVRSLALMIACDGQPLLNLRVRKFLATEFSPQCAEKWFRHWMHLNLQEFEATLARDNRPGRYSHGDSPTLADVCLIPQILMARRFNVPVLSYSRLMRIFEACMALPAFSSAVAQSEENRYAPI